ncbi:putative protein kinase CAMK-OST1L family [Helianthus annuus]|nr:putative protein kinase CAMK-OST1L family [Helianthus annuus]
MADVWSCGVTLYVMLVGAYLFEDPEEPKNFRKTIQVNIPSSCFWQYMTISFAFINSNDSLFFQRILNVHYSIPSYVHISTRCRQLMSKIFIADPAKRITMDEIRNHEWFTKNLPGDLVNENAVDQFGGTDQPTQSVDEIMQIIAEATIPAAGPKTSSSTSQDAWILMMTWMRT